MAGPAQAYIDASLKENIYMTTIKCCFEISIFIIHDLRKTFLDKT